MPPERGKDMKMGYVSQEISIVSNGRYYGDRGYYYHKPEIQSPHPTRYMAIAKWQSMRPKSTLRQMKPPML
jgi:hypothetical protein